MSLTQVGGLALIFILCPILGGLPLIRWIAIAFTGKNLAQLGTGNLSVSAAFYHGGQTVGILAVLSEAFKGVAAVLLARYFFPNDPTWEIVALMALVMGRYWMGKGAGTTNVVWGFVVHDWIGAGLIFLISGVTFTVLRERKLGKLAVLVIMPIVTALRHPDSGGRIGAVVLLCGLIAWIYQKIPDDLDLSANTAQENSRQMFKFFRGDRAIPTLDQILDPQKVGAKAATLSQLKRRYPVPMGWVLRPGDDPAPLIELLQPSAESPLIVRSSAIGEDSELASAAGQYESIANVVSRGGLERAILRCQASYDAPHAVRYRQDRGVPEAGMAVLVQQQVRGVFSGVAFSRDPILRQGDAVVIEAVSGGAAAVVSGQVTPQQYRLELAEGDLEGQNLEIQSAQDVEGVEAEVIRQVAILARQLEAEAHGVPQDVEWSYDGQQLWLLQSRPITTLLPIWTRKIAAEVIPGFIAPLTWSVNRPLTCGVWGEIFTIVLGDRARHLNFNETATLHHSVAYFNATLLGEIFHQMGLPAESLEFLTRGAKFGKPPILSTLKNVPGLLKLWQRERQLERDFEQDDRQFFQPGFADLMAQPLESLATPFLLRRIDRILSLLKRATYYSIMAPLSLALRQAIFRVETTELDYQQLPEVASLRSLRSLAAAFPVHPVPQTFSELAETTEGRSLRQEFNQFLQDYGYLSDVATDISVPRWREDAAMLESLLLEYLRQDSPESPAHSRPSWKTRRVQRRVDLKGQVTEVYSKLLAELRWSFLALERQWLAAGHLAATGDIAFVKWDEMRHGPDELPKNLAQLIASRRSQLDSDRQATPPQLVYGDDPPFLQSIITPVQSAQQLQGIGASPGQIEGVVRVVRQLQNLPDVNRETILVVPYTDSGWSPLLARAGGLIAEVGGQLSHGAIVAREYGIPAVMNIAQATQKLRDGQRVRLDGRSGRVEVL
jgi:phosphohistidine swiveling domain-containing protein/glycerol-3-phosphate acyltransferase PlsY